MKRKTETDETVDADWMAPFMAPGEHVEINVDDKVMTAQQRAEAMARGVPMGVTNMGKFVEQGVKTSKVQKEKASKARADKALESIVGGLAQRVGTAKELWPALWGELDGARCDPEEHTDGEQRQWKIEYFDAKGHKRKVSFDTFQRMVGKNRKPA